MPRREVLWAGGCNGVRSQNNSGGVWCPAGISNGVNLEEDE